MNYLLLKPQKIELNSAFFLNLWIGSILILSTGISGCRKCPCKARIDYSSINVNADIVLDSLYSPVDSIILKEVSEEIGTISYAIDSFKLIKSYKHARNRMLHVLATYNKGQVHYCAIFEPKIDTIIGSDLHPVLLFASGLNQIDPSVHLNNNHTLYKILDDLPGYYVIVPSYRGQALVVESKRYCSDGFFGDAFDGAAIDAGRCIQYGLDHLTDIDSSKVCIYGISRGATVGLILATRFSFLDKIIIQSGPYNFLDRSAYWRYGKQYKYQFLSEKEGNYNLRKKILRSSPYYFIDRINGKLHIIHGKDDKVVPVSQFEDLRHKLANTESEFYLRSGGHKLLDWTFVKSLLLE